MAKEISRRSFLKGAAAGAVGMAVASLSGATVFAEDGTSSALTGSSAEPAVLPAGYTPTGEDCTYGSFLNPQDASGFHDSGNLSHLFSPLKIGGVTLKNRIMKSAAGSDTHDSANWPNESLAFYGQFCDGGVGMICYEYTGVIPMPSMGLAGMPGDAAPAGMPGMPDGAAGAIPAMDGTAGMPAMDGMPAMPAMDGAAGMPTMDSAPATDAVPATLPESGHPDLSTDAGIPVYKVIADYIHAKGTPVIGQIYDMMAFGGSSSTVKHDFEMENSLTPGTMQSTEAVQTEIQQFIDGAERMQKAGFDGIEINASCSHYFSTFLSRFSNTERTDQYSGETVENRARIITEIIEGIRERLGNEFIIQVLYSGVEENVAHLGDNDLCTTIEEACEFAKLFEKAGASSLHIRSQAYGHHCAGFMPDVFHIQEHGYTGYGTVLDYGKHYVPVQGQYNGYAGLLEVAARIKSCVNIPVGAVGAMDPRVTPDLIDNAIADGKLDYILVTRPLMADPNYCKKLEAGEKDDIAPCTRCMTCFVAPYDRGIPMYCRVNAALSRAFTPDMPEGYDPLPADPKQKVLVIGGGPAGMEAARIAAQRGHTVTLLEKEKELGLTLCELAAIKGPHERIADHLSFLINQLNKYGVTVRTGVEVTADVVKAENPDSVIVAVGGCYSQMDVPGFELVEPAGALAEGMDGENFVILGGQFQGCEAAISLARKNKTINVINTGSKDQVYLNGATWPRLMGKTYLNTKGVKFWHNAVVESIDREGVNFESESGVKMRVPADHVINALPKTTNRALFDELTETGIHVFAVGDCYSPGTIANAVARANIVARNVEKQQQTADALVGDNVYTATAQGIGDVTVSIRVEGGQITEAVVDTSNETQGIGRPLGEQFAQQIIEKHSVDAVSGASLTSGAVNDALMQCLKEAGL
jgi:2,4-dienoyl-CoA reductase-like NADH-dependent reductase (Old Yellow Enzyme family)/pyruvate/2-oxoglutarate dehydrogenase complex dihydrolipoamide dehydrogenase (E3) component